MDSWVLGEEAPYLGDAVIDRDGRFSAVCLDSTFWFTLLVVKENPDAPAAKAANESIDRILFVLQFKVWY